MNEIIVLIPVFLFAGDIIVLPKVAQCTPCLGLSGVAGGGGGQGGTFLAADRDSHKVEWI